MDKLVYLVHMAKTATEKSKEDINNATLFSDYMNVAEIEEDANYFDSEDELEEESDEEKDHGEEDGKELEEGDEAAINDKKSLGDKVINTFAKEANI